MLPDFASIRPESKRDALDALASLAGAAVIAGGTDLLVRMKKGETYYHVIDITALADLKGIAREDTLLRIGAATSHTEISGNRLIAEGARSLALASASVGSPQIRNMGTIGGNIVNASPAADTMAPLLIHDAMVHLESKEKVRNIEFERFITDPYKTVIKGDEIVSSVTMQPLTGYTEGYRRVAKRATLAISRLSIAWAMHEEGGVFRDARLAIGSCTPMPFRPRTVENFLRGQKRKKNVIDEAVNMVVEEIQRISGARPSFLYKLPVVKDLLQGILGGTLCL